MRLILLLVALAIVALLSVRALQPHAPATPPEADAGAVALPRVPQAPGEVKQFQQDMNHFVQDQAQKQERDIDRSTQ